MERILSSQKLTIKDFEEGVEFEVDRDQFNDDFSDQEFEEDYSSFKADIIDVEGQNKPRFLGGTDTPFNVLKEKMEPITEDGLVLKSIVSQGTGQAITDKTVVVMHFEGFIEGRKEPFDSSRLRGRPFKFLAGDGRLVIGLELAILGMKQGEISRILVSPEYAYGPMGCPPRIPENAEILFEVEIKKIYLSKEAVEYEEMKPEDQRKVPFEKKVAVYHVENLLAKDLFRGKQYGAAIGHYRKVAKVLEDINVANEEEDKKRNGYLLKIYNNLAQCYINKQDPKKAVTFASLGLKIDDKNRKGLFRMGKALHMLSEYDQAEKYLNKAKKYYPLDKDISRIILQLQQKRKQHEDWERIFAMKAMEKTLDEENKKVVFEESPEFVNTIRKRLETFVESDEQEAFFSPGYTESQLNVVKILAQELELPFVSKIQNDKKINKVAKKKLSS
ncbi:hypothetical protein JTE90_019145 [Oedothorax gibbosus]|uniref:peptidylprolyl isomerase n=1 Tax=Oedothorax gibbosus TaxID=931172 RepID=A0AAV6US70_9ARAC|nr:hypothetical protein JTE90_019145 [Oedothorax gibbosus]